MEWKRKLPLASVGKCFEYLDHFFAATSFAYSHLLPVSPSSLHCCQSSTNQYCSERNKKQYAELEMKRQSSMRMVSTGGSLRTGSTDPCPICLDSLKAASYTTNTLVEGVLTCIHHHGIRLLSTFSPPFADVAILSMTRVFYAQGRCASDSQAYSSAACVVHRLRP